VRKAQQLIAAGATATEAFVRLAEDGHRPPPALAQAVCVAVTGVSWQRAAEIFDEVFMGGFADETDFRETAQISRQQHIEITAARLNRGGYFDAVPVHDNAGQQIHDQFLTAMRHAGGGPGWPSMLRCHRAGDFVGTFRHLVRVASAEEVSEPDFWTVMTAIADLLDADARQRQSDERWAIMLARCSAIGCFLG